MKKLFLSFAIAASSILWPAVVQAEVLDKPAEIIAKVKSGAQGAWFDAEATKKCLASDVDLEKCRKIRDNLQAQVNSLTTSVELLTASVENLTKQKDEWLDQSKDAMVRAQNAELELEKWYRNPWVVGVIGVAAGATVVSIVVGATR